MKLLLASSSPRRSELLTAHGIPFDTDPPHVDETFDPELSPSRNALLTAIKKAEAMAGRYNDRPVLAADTIVVLEGGILGKPKNKDDAITMLKAISGKEHMVITGISLIWRDKNINWSHAEESLVLFKQLPHDFITDYVNSGEPMDKAGGYAIQGGAKEWIERYRGSLTNIIGLPMEPVLAQLKEMGFTDGEKAPHACR